MHSNPISILTPFHRGSINLPKKSDIKRILDKTNQAYITVSPLKKKKIKRTPTVERTLHEIKAKLKVINTGYGHIQIRKDLSDKIKAPTVNLFEQVIPLNQAL